MPGPDQEPREGCYSGDDLTTRIFQWFKNLYGDKLKVEWGVGSIAVELAGDIYEIKYPWIIGSVKMIADPSTMSQKDQMIDNKPAVNALSYIKGLSPQIASSLNQQQLHELLQIFYLGYSCLDKMGYAARDTENPGQNLLIPEALGDLKASSTHLLERPPELGLSKWSSLQAVEKMIKAYISPKGGSFKWTHSLTELANEAEKLGLVPISRNDIQVVQCSPSVRYDSSGLTLTEVVAAQHAAIRVCNQIIENL